MVENPDTTELIPRLGSRFRFTPKTLFCALAGAMFILLSAAYIFYPPSEHLLGADFWEHAAAIEQLTAHPLHPPHPEYATDAPSRDYMPWYLAFALLARAFSLSPFAAMTLVSIANLALILAGMYLFFREYFQNEWAPAFGLVSMLFLWGEPWSWSSFYNVRSLAETGPYPSTFVFGLTFVAWWAGLRMLRARRVAWPHLLSLAAFGALLFLGHQLSGLFAIAGLVCLLLFEPAPGPKRRALLIAALLAGTALTRFWPWFDPFYAFDESRNGSGMWLGDDNFYRTLSIAGWAGPALLGLGAVVHFFRRRIYLGTAVGFAAVLAVYIDLRMGAVPQGQRLVLPMIFYLHIALTWLLLALCALPRATRALAIIACAGFALFHIGIAGAEIFGGVLDRPFPGLPIYRLGDIRGPMTQLAAPLPADAVVISSCRLSLTLPVFRGRVVSICRTSPLVPDDIDRLKATVAFFADATPIEERRRIATQYRAAYIAFAWGDLSPRVWADIQRIAVPFSASGPLALFRLR